MITLAPEIPCAPDVEQAVLGACLYTPETVADIADFMRPAVFYDRSHQTIWEAIATMYARRNPIDIVTITSHLRASDKLDEVGGPIYIAKLTNAIASTSNTVYHARILVELHVKREAIRLGMELQKSGADVTKDAFDTLAGISSEIRILNEYGASDERSMAEIMPEVIDNQGPDRGIPFGYPDIDKILRGEPGTMTIIGARPAMGKTAFMLSSAWRQTQGGHTPYIVQMEMKDRNLATRLVCGECGIPVWKAKRKMLDGRDTERMAKWYVDNGADLGRMLINETASMTVSSLAARLDRAKRRKGIDVVWIDYIGLLQPTEKARDAYSRMTKISNELRVLSKEIDLPFIVLAQLSRPVKGAAVKAPVLTDLRDSGEIEQDAEAVAFLHRPRYYDPGESDDVQFIVAKNRDGEDGIAHLTFDGPGVRMLDGSSGTSFPVNEETPF